MIIDAHCDVLMKMYRNPLLDFNAAEPLLDVNYPLMKQGGVKIQFMAVYLPEEIKNPDAGHILEYVDILHRRVLCNPDIVLIQSRSDLQHVLTTGKRGVLLTLEGAEGLRGSLAQLRMLYRLGLRSIGPAWNFANWAVDGAMETRNGGFTLRGQQLIKESNHLGVLFDASHLSEKAFWEAADVPGLHLFASHSNAKSACDHPRNLTDGQIRCLIERKGMIGITFVPWFVKKNGPVFITDLFRHIDHICSLGGEDFIGFGSDFDGIDNYIHGLENAGMYANLANELYKHYTPVQAQKFLWQNGYAFLERSLPVS
ncbi:dipeptidase [Paenibacillus chitinolyticus]|uniref:dipeptidase n=1 Tax=Paenibacillus chitinolyticus TaxID=79263 RepID=UPI003CFD142C